MTGYATGDSVNGMGEGGIWEEKGVEKNIWANHELQFCVITKSDSIDLTVKSFLYHKSQGQEKTITKEFQWNKTKNNYIQLLQTEATKVPINWTQSK